MDFGWVWCWSLFAKNLILTKKGRGLLNYIQFIDYLGTQSSTIDFASRRIGSAVWLRHIVDTD